jgi:cob(I)alamin adenosyltransferase
MKKGLIQIYTGNGKGKTTAAVGQAVRALGRGYRVMMVQWLKDGSSGEIVVLKKLGVEALSWGGDYGKKLIANLPLEDKGKIIQKSEAFFEQVVEKIKGGRYDLLILDEITIAVKLGLIGEDKVLRWLKNKPSSLEVILTGGEVTSRLVSIADLITEMKKVKHPYEQGIKMRRGIEY